MNMNANRYKHLSHELLRKIDEAIEAGVKQVESDHEMAAQANVSLSFAIGYNKDDELIVAFTNKSGVTEKGSFTPSRQPRLALAE